MSLCPPGGGACKYRYMYFQVFEIKNCIFLRNQGRWFRILSWFTRQTYKKWKFHTFIFWIKSVNFTLLKRKIKSPPKCSPRRETPPKRVPINKIKVAASESDLSLHGKALVSEILAFVLISQTLCALKKLVHPPLFDLKIGYPYVIKVADSESEKKFWKILK